MTRNNLPEILAKRNIPQADLARGIKKSPAFVSRLLSGKVGASADTIDDILSFLEMSYEECFVRRRRRTRSATEPVRS